MKNNDILYLAIGAAIIGYLLFKNGGVLNTAAASPTPAINPALPPAFSYSSGIALEQPSTADIGVIAPAVNPTGQTINFI
jgi:hypothetical protein